jgi:tetratricopeptide (TPR) repeat protein
VICLRRRWAGRAFALAAELTRYWTTAGLWREGLTALTRVLELRPDEIGGRDCDMVNRSDGDAAGIDPRDEVVVLGGVARLSAMWNDLKAALSTADRAAALAREIGDVPLLARALRDAGAAYWYAVQIDRSEALFREALELTEGIGDTAALAVCLGNVAAIHGARLEHAQALALYERQLELSRKVGDRLGVAKALFSSARMLDRLDRPGEAVGPLLESLQVHRETRDLPGIALCLHNLGDACISLERFEEARTHLVEALRIRLQLGNNYGICSVLLSLGRGAEAAGDPESMAEILGGVFRALEELDVPILEVQRAQLAGTRAKIEQKMGPERATSAIARGSTRSLSELASWAIERFATTKAVLGGRPATTSQRASGTD